MRTLNLLDRHQVVRNHSFILPQDSKLYVHLTQYSTRVFEQSGSLEKPRLHLALDEALKTSINQTFPNAVYGDLGQSTDEILMNARKTQAHFLIVPSILLSQDNTSSPNQYAQAKGEELGRDRQIIKIVIIDVYSGRILDTLRIDSKARWLSDKSPDSEFLGAATLAGIEMLSSTKIQ